MSFTASVNLKDEERKRKRKMCQRIAKGYWRLNELQSQGASPEAISLSNSPRILLAEVLFALIHVLSWGGAAVASWVEEPIPTATRDAEPSSPRCSWWCRAAGTRPGPRGDRRPCALLGSAGSSIYTCSAAPRSFERWRCRRGEVFLTEGKGSLLARCMPIT